MNGIFEWYYSGKINNLFYKVIHCPTRPYNGTDYIRGS